MSKREVPTLNRDNFLAWKFLMKLHLGGLRDHAQSTITIEHVDPTGALIAEDLKKKKKDYLGFIEIWKLRLDVIFSFPGSFFFSVVAPLNLEKLDASGSGGSESFLQNTDGYFGIC